MDWKGTREKNQGEEKECFGKGKKDGGLEMALKIKNLQ